MNVIPETPHVRWILIPTFLLHNKYVLLFTAFNTTEVILWRNDGRLSKISRHIRYQPRSTSTDIW